MVLTIRVSNTLLMNIHWRVFNGLTCHKSCKMRSKWPKIGIFNAFLRLRQHKNALAMPNSSINHGICDTISENVPYELVFSDKTQVLAPKQAKNDHFWPILSLIGLLRGPLVARKYCFNAYSFLFLIVFWLIIPIIYSLQCF